MRARRWTLRRLLADRALPQVLPGRHHTLWSNA